MAHKYLEELDSYAPIFTDEQLNDDPRNKRWKEQTKVYGFDDTETWDLDRTFYLWLYEHLRMYEDTAKDIIDLNFQKYTYNQMTYTQLELIHLMLDRIRFFFSEDYDPCKLEHIDMMKDVGSVWAIVLQDMWW